jgi:hypothetical protein
MTNFTLKVGIKITIVMNEQRAVKVGFHRKNIGGKKLIRFGCLNAN